MVAAILYLDAKTRSTQKIDKAMALGIIRRAPAIRQELFHPARHIELRGLDDDAVRKRRDGDGIQVDGASGRDDHRSQGHLQGMANRFARLRLRFARNGARVDHDDVRVPLVYQFEPRAMELRYKAIGLHTVYPTAEINNGYTLIAHVTPA